MKIAKDYALDIKYKMNETELQAYNIGLYWIAISRKLFPNYNHSKGYPNNGDPRKSSLFKYCYKLVKETKNLIKPDEYKFYIKAQLDLLKCNVENPIIDPSCLIGDKAWIRWKIWKKEYERKTIKKLLSNDNLNFSLDKICNMLKSTKQFFKIKFKNCLDKENFINNKNFIEQWASYGNLDPFYIILSPLVNEFCNIEIDKSLYLSFINEEVKLKFKEIFNYEF